MYKCFQGAVGEYFATVFPKELWVALHMGRLCSHLAVGGCGSAVLSCAVTATPSQHEMKLCPSRTWVHDRLVRAQLKQWRVFGR